MRSPPTVEIGLAEQKVAIKTYAFSRLLNFLARDLSGTMNLHSIFRIFVFSSRRVSSWEDRARPVFRFGSESVSALNRFAVPRFLDFLPILNFFNIHC